MSIRLKHNIIFLITAMFVAIACILFAPNAFADEDIASGVRYDDSEVNWRITSDGTLIIGKEGETQYLNNVDPQYLWGTHDSPEGDYFEPNTIYVKKIKFIGHVVMRNVSSLNGVTRHGMEYMFTGNTWNSDAAWYPYLESIDFTNLDTSHVTSMANMFYNCQTLKSIKWGNIDTSNVEDMSNMFFQCLQLTNLDLSCFNTSKVTTMYSMFNSCRVLKTVNVSSFDTSNLGSQGLDYMFADCSSLAKIDISNFRNSDNGYLQYTTSLFYNDYNLNNITIGSDYIGLKSFPQPPYNSPYTGKWITYHETVGPYSAYDLKYNVDPTEDYATKWVWEGTKLNWKGKEEPPVFLTQEGTQIDVTLDDRIYLNGLPETTTAQVDPATVTNNLSSVGIRVSSLIADGTNNAGYVLEDYNSDFTTYPADSHKYAMAYQSTDLKEGVELDDLIPASGSKEYNFFGKAALSTETITAEDNKNIGSLIFTVGLDKYTYPYWRPEPSALLGKAYAVFDDDANLIFFRSNNKYEPGPNQTVVDIKGNEYTGTIFTDFENTGDMPWVDIRDAVIKTYVAEGSAITPVSIRNWFEMNNVTLIDLSGFDLSKIDAIGNMGTYGGTQEITINMSNKYLASLTANQNSNSGDNHIYIVNGTINFDNSRIENVDNLNDFTITVDNVGTINLQNTNFDCVQTVTGDTAFQGTSVTLNMQNTSWANFDVGDDSARIASVRAGNTRTSTLNAQNAKFPKVTRGIFYVGNVNYDNQKAELNLNGAEFDSLESTAEFMGTLDGFILNMDGTKLPALKHLDYMAGSIGNDTEYNLSNLDLSNVEDGHFGATSCVLNLTNVDLSGMESAGWFAHGFGGSESSVNFTNVDFSGMTDASNMFNLDGGTPLILDNCDFSNATSFNLNNVCSRYTWNGTPRVSSTIIRNISFDSLEECESLLDSAPINMTFENVSFPVLKDASYMFANDYSEWWRDNYTIQNTLPNVSLTFDNVTFGPLEETDHMFENCPISSLDLSFITDTSHITTMEGMFKGSRIEELDISHFTAPENTNTKEMFANCEGLESLDLRSLSTSNVTTMNFMFSDCPNLEHIYVGSGWSTASVVPDEYDSAGYGMFYHDEKLPNFDSNFTDINKAYHEHDLVKTDGLGYLEFAGTVRPITIEDRTADTNELLGSISKNVPLGYILNLQTIKPTRYAKQVNGEDVIYTVSTEAQLTPVTEETNTIIRVFEVRDNGFYDGEAMAHLDWDSGVITFLRSEMTSQEAYEIGYIEDLNGTRYPYGNGANTSLYDGLENEYSYLELDSSLTEIQYAPGQKIRPISISGWFQYFGGETIDLSGLDLSICENMSGAFYYCTNLESVDFENLNTSQVQDFSSMFQGCSKLTTLDLSSLDTSSATNLSYMFYECSNLTSVDLSSFDTSNVTYIYEMFSNCLNLQHIYVGDGWNMTKVLNEGYSGDMFYQCNSLHNYDDYADCDATKAYVGEGGYLEHK